MSTQGKRLKAIRQALKLTQEQLGSALGISKQFYSNIETDRTLLNNEKLVGIGTLQFMGCNELILSEHLSGYSLSYLATHGREDYIPEKGAEPVYYG